MDFGSNPLEKLPFLIRIELEVISTREVTFLLLSRREDVDVGQDEVG